VVIEELLGDYERHRDLILALSRSDRSRVREAARRIIECRESGRCQCLPLWPEAARFREDWQCLENFCWQLSARRDPRFKPARGATFLDRMAYQVSEKAVEYAAGVSPAFARVKALQSVLHRRYGFTGNCRDYYHPDNSHLNRVIESRKGIPLTLSLLSIFIGQRLDWDVQGLNFPGHFMAACDNVAFDPFHNGVIVTRECLAARFMLPPGEFDDLTVYHASPLMVAQRLLGNLLNAYQRAGDVREFERVQSYLRSLQDAA